MAFVGKINLEERVGSFVIEDNSGTWSPSYPYGFGVPTIIPAWVTSVTAYIKPPGYTSTILKELGADFAGNGNQAQIMPWDLGLEKIESGIWEVKVVWAGEIPANNQNPTARPFSYQTTQKCVFTKEVECCVDTMVANTQNVPLNDVFRDEKSRLTSELSTLLQIALKGTGCSGGVVAKNKIITFIKDHCRCGCSH